MHEMSEFYREINVDDLPLGASHREFKATPEECRALAQRFEIVAINSFDCRVTLVRLTPGDQVDMAAEFQAEVTQNCVVTLEDFSTQVTGQCECRFSSLAPGETDPEVDFEPESDDPPEPIADGLFDAGAILAEYLGLSLDPFPRAPEVDFEDIIEDNGENDDNPFAVLKSRI